MSRPRWLAPAFPKDIPPFVDGLTLQSAPDLKLEPDSAEHAAVVSRIADGLGLEGIGWAKQVHGDVVLRVEKPGYVGAADALWCDQPGLGVIGRSADCPIVLVAGFKADETPVWGMAHASWRSTAAEITTRLMAAMKSGGLVPATARAMIGPSAGPCCYEVGDEVRRALLTGIGDDAETFFRPHGDRLILDLWKANIAALIEGGIPSGALFIDGRCTICGTGFASYRTEGRNAGRFGLVVGIFSRLR